MGTGAYYSRHGGIMILLMVTVVALAVFGPMLLLKFCLFAKRRIDKMKGG
jgi:hypothetical protein